ncbi:unnamed protein product, partial [marine sediment metagenome]
MATLSEAWEFAEKQAFDRLRDYLNAEENRDAWLGEIPDLMVNAWEFSTGGTSTEPIARTYGTDGLWCNLPIGATLTARYQNRSECLKLGGKIYAFLRETNNLHDVGAVHWLRLDGYIEQGRIQA